MNFIYIEHAEYENIFETISEAEEFLLAHRKDGNEFYVTWYNQEGEVIEQEGWMYQASTFEDQNEGEFKISPDAALGDYDKNCQWISAGDEDGEVYEALSQYYRSEDQ